MKKAIFIALAAMLSLVGAQANVACTGDFCFDIKKAGGITFFTATADKKGGQLEISCDTTEDDFDVGVVWNSPAGNYNDTTNLFAKFDNQSELKMSARVSAFDKTSTTAYHPPRSFIGSVISSYGVSFRNSKGGSVSYDLTGTGKIFRHMTRGCGLSL